MHAVFFVCRPEEASGVSSIDDLPGDSAAEPLAVDSPGAVAGLVSALGAKLRESLGPLRDATCQSFPVWTFSQTFAAAIEGLDDGDLECVARRWLACTENAFRDADLYELSVCLGELRDAIRARAPEEQLFVLLEEKAW